ncbi:MAG: Asp-tRNA(Asn)/Glu-tRNA(Gln) amidotransferase subunit GatB [Candidatus Aenigmarchaeota archaeon]|nr:Asp-tRNA(Asn)/Glu-tRNA(Gln) amidotransferase subunit GatB [Candidatus Aenigmarchaeota archaeon]
MKVKIGLEIHVQLNTKSKLFCSCSTNSENSKPNKNICPTCMGLPGSKPALNKEALKKAMRLALALNCSFPKAIFFSRKSYFYPDMPKNFQITQYEIPIGKNGSYQLKNKKIGIWRVHIEEDPGKLIHKGGTIKTAQNVLIDYNRAGIPLCEIVTAPDFSSIEEVKEFLSGLISTLEHLRIYDPLNGSIRSDINISIMGGSRVEVKNVNGIKAVEHAIKYELSRQKNMVKIGKKIKMETRHFDADMGTTVSLRTKETEEDYGYIFEPDLTWIDLTKEFISDIKKNMPELPKEREKRFLKQYKISRSEASVICMNFRLAELFERVAKQVDAKLASKWLRTVLIGVLAYKNLSLRTAHIDEKKLIKALKLLESGEITEKTCKELIIKLVNGEKFDPANYVVEKRLKKVADKKELEKVIKDALKENKKAVSDYKSGQKEAIHYLAGQVMKKTGGRAEMRIVMERLKELLNSI